jgi:hypothetical protein
MTRAAAGRAVQVQKLMYPAPRPEASTPAAVAPRWAEHQREILTMPLVQQRVSRYELCQALTPADEPDLPAAFFAPGGISDAWAGVGEAWIDGGMAGLVAIGADPDVLAARDREAGVFGRPIEDSMAVQDEVVFDHGDTQLKIFSFLRRQAHLSLDEFADAWGGFAELFLEHGELTRHCSSYVQSHVVDPPPELRFDGAAIMGFRTIADMSAFMAEPSMVEELFLAEEPFIDRSQGVVVLTRPMVLYDRSALT